MAAPDRAPVLLLTALSAFLGAAAVGRVRSLDTLSPPDLAFFTQSTWSAASGLGFAQTALEFDQGSLLGSIHLSLVRLLWVPLWWARPSPSALTALQALAVSTIVWLAWTRQPGRGLTLAGALALGLHPLAMALACVDLRPIVFFVPGAALVVAGLARERATVVFGGAVLCVLAREEAPWVLGAMLPFAVHLGHRRRRWAGSLVLCAAVLTAIGLPLAVWGHGSNITSSADPLATVQQILAGTRPVFRWSQETRFFARCVAAGVPALLAPRLLAPALLGWLWLMVFSDLEPVAPGSGGLHYLAVVAALFLPAVGVGMHRAAKRWGAPKVGIFALLMSILAGSPEIVRSATWAVHTPATAQALTALVQPLKAHTLPVLVPPLLAPHLAARPTLRILGHFAADPERVSAVAHEVHDAVLAEVRPPAGPAADEWALWQAALVEAGLQPVATAAGWSHWTRAVPK